MYEFTILAFNSTPSHIRLEQSPLGALKEGQRYFIVHIVKQMKTEHTFFSKKRRCFLIRCKEILWDFIGFGMVSI